MVEPDSEGSPITLGFFATSPVAAFLLLLLVSSCSMYLSSSDLNSNNTSMMKEITRIPQNTYNSCAKCACVTQHTPNSVTVYPMLYTCVVHTCTVHHAEISKKKSMATQLHAAVDSSSNRYMIVTYQCNQLYICEL